MKPIFKPTTLLLTLFFILLTGYSQAQEVKGKVISADSGEPIAGVSVLKKGTTTGTLTDDGGVFTINASPTDVLVFTSVGYATKEQTVGANITDLIITLVPSTSKMDEVVIVGYGTQKRSKITGSVSKLDSRVLETGVRSNPATALAGTIPGLRVQINSGRPGAVPHIVLRGGTTFGGDGSPLVVVDGVLRSGFSDINPNDIASIEVLKDAAATAIYGARASNGVILITTKRGKNGVSKITLDSRVGFNKLNLPFDFIGARDYLYWSRKSVQTSGIYSPGRLNMLSSSGPFGTGNKYLDNDGNIIDGNESSLGVWSTMILNNNNRVLLQQGWQTMIDPVYGDTLIFKDFDYTDYALRPSPITHDHNISMSGGNDKGKYYAGLGVFDQEGFPINTFYKRITFVLNGEYEIKPWLTSHSSLNYARARWRDPQTNSIGNYLTRSLGAPPTMRGRNADGELLVGRNSQDGNPAVNDDKFIQKNQTDKFTLSQAFKVNFLPNLYLRTSANWYYEEGLYEAFNRDFLAGPGRTNTTRSSAASFNREFSQTYNAILNYSGETGKHSIDAMVGTEYYDNYARGLSASGHGAPTDDFMDLGLTSSDKDERDINSFHVRQRILSFFGRATYAYDNRFLLTGVFRRDGYSKLLNHRWGNFPGVSAGWIISNEDFFEPLKNTINHLKLRASYGVNGNIDPDKISAYNLQGIYGTRRYNSNIGYSLNNLPFPNLYWERSKTIEFGLDATLIHKLDLSLSIYNRKTDNKITDFRLPATSGFTNLTTNNGTMQNTGVELQLDYRAIRTGDWRVDFSINGAYNANKILLLPENGLPNNRQGGFQVFDPESGKVIWVGGLQEGMDPNVAYAWQVADLYRTQKDLEADGNRVDLEGYKILLGTTAYNNLPAGQQGDYYPIALGDVKWKDLDKNDTIDYRDRAYMGRTVPRWIGGFSTYATWKNFFINVRLDFALGFVAYDGPHAWFQSMAQGSFNTISDVFDTYTPENTDAKYPTYYWADQLFKNNTFRSSSMFYHKGDYLAFREVSIGYTLPEEWASKFYAQGATISFTGQNLGYISQSTLYSPESESVGIGGGGYPLPRTFIAALKLTF